MLRRALGLASAIVFVGWVVGCSDDEDHHAGTKPPSCQAIIDACHPLDTGSGPINDCHEAAHTGTATEESCAARKTECINVTCKPSDGGTDGG